MSQQLLVKSKTSAYYLTQNANLLKYSQLFSNAAWVKTGCSLTAGQTDPNSGTEAFKLTASASNATILQTVSLDDALNRTFSIYIRRVTGTGDVSITADGTTYSVVTTTETWERFNVEAASSGNVIVGVKLATSGDEVDIAWAQFEDGGMTDVTTNLNTRYGIVQITDPDYPKNTVRGGAFLDGRFFVMTPKGEIQQSALEDAGSWSALEFIQSQSDPGEGVYITKVENYVMTFKDWSTEFFYDAANATGSVLAPVQNAAFQIGCASDASVQDVNGTIFWMGQTRAGFGRSIYRLDGTTPVKISTPSVDKVLDSDDLGEVYSWSATVGAHLLYGITLINSNVTLVCDVATQVWSFFTHLTISGSSTAISAISATGVVTSAAHGYSDGDIIKVSNTTSDFDGWYVATDVTANTYQIQSVGAAFTGSGSAQKYIESYFPIVASVRAHGRQYMQGKSDGGLYEFSQSYTTDNVGAIAMRIRSPRADDGTMNIKTFPSLELVGDKVDSVALVRHSSDDYVTNSNFRPVSLGNNRSRIRRLGKANRRSFEILHVGDALVRLEAIELE